MKNTLGVIPARMASSRFPGKPLKKILNIPMLAHCYERALLSGVCDNLVIATPDQVIIDWATQFEIPSVLTSHSHKRATEKVTELLLHKHSVLWQKALVESEYGGLMPTGKGNPFL